VDLLVLTAFSDHRLSQGELEALDRLDSEHTDWDQGAFNVNQYVPVAMAKVRAALDHPEGAEQLLAESVARITTPEIRAQTARACLDLAAEGALAPEAEFARRVGEALA